MRSTQNNQRRPAVFLDKDGTLIHDVPYNVNPALIRFLPGTREAVQCVHEAGFQLVVITNQSGVARGFFAEADLAQVEREHVERVAAGLEYAALIIDRFEVAGERREALGDS